VPQNPCFLTGALLKWNRELGNLLVISTKQSGTNQYQKKRQHSHRNEKSGGLGLGFMPQPLQISKQRILQQQQKHKT